MTKPKRIFISNRLPFSLNAKTGAIKRGSGGLVSALLGVKLDEPFYWLGFETDLKVAEQLSEKAQEVDQQLRLSPVILDKKLYDNYYDKFSNDVLWPLFHYEGQHVIFKRDYWEAYKTANQKMADAILKIANDEDIVWIHDFHFFLLPALLKEKKPNLKIGFFLHIPFPSSEIFKQLPVREEILNGLIKADLIGFHDHSYLRHFTVTLTAQLGIDTSVFRAKIGDHTLNLGVYPISIDNEHLREAAASEKVAQLSNKYENKIKSDFLILGIDRLDYSKGLELKLRGFRRLLQKYPELKGQVNLLQLAVPTRTGVPAYAKLKREIDQLVGTINGEFGHPGYVPVHYIYNSVNENELLSLYRRAECLLVTSKRDGMNLVAMEYIVAKDLQNPGVLVLSEFVGAASLLGDALFINPWDEDSIADALYAGFKMSPEERKERLNSSQDILSKYSATQWAQSFLNDLNQTQRKQIKNRTVQLSAKNSYFEIIDRVRQAKKCKLVLDYDGTLVPLQKRPDLAVLSHDLRERLFEINKHIPVYIVSGRAKTFLDTQFVGGSLLLAAEHGAFYKEPNGDWRSRISSDINSWYSEVERVMNSYSERVPNSLVELKEAALVWHYRMSPEKFANYQARKLDDELQVGLANLPVSIVAGSKMLEARAVECHKGDFLRWLIEQDDDSLYICIGDDRTDEDMFNVAAQNGLSIKVGDHETAAQFRVSKQEEVAGLIESIANVSKRL